MARTFTKTDGDLRAVLQTMFTSREFFSEGARQSKIKSPLEMVVSAARALDAATTDSFMLAQKVADMGEPLYGAQPPTGYSDKAEAWVNTGALMNRLNFALALAANKMPGVRVDEGSVMSLDIGVELAAETKKTIEERGSDRITTAGLILGSPEFQRQ